MMRNPPCSLVPWDRFETSTKLQTCLGCPAQEECRSLSDASEAHLSPIHYGDVWGGETPHERAIRRGKVRGDKRGRLFPGGECRNGHPINSYDDLYVRATGWSTCRECNRESQARKQAKKKQEPPLTRRPWEGIGNEAVQ